MKEITDADSDVVDVAYKAMNGEIRVMPWTDVDPVAVADGRPWREFPWYLGQRHYSGMYWSATEAKLVGYESLLELSRLLMADFDRSSKRIVSQPFQIKAGIEGERLTRIPDYLVLSEDEPLVIDVTRRARKYAPLRTHAPRRGIQRLEIVGAFIACCRSSALSCSRRLEGVAIGALVGLQIPSLDLSQDVVADFGGCRLRDRPHERVSERAGEGRHRGYRVCGGVP
jgi:hypothetical protein